VRYISTQLGVPDEGYTRNVSCALNWISPFLLLPLARHFCRCTISTRWYNPPSSQCFGSDMDC